MFKIGYNIEYMASVENRLAKILADAEAAALQVLAEAAASGNYAAIDRAKAIAEQLKALGAGVDRKSDVAASPPRPRNKKGKRRKKTPKKGEYPRFKIEGGSLFKIGWSKKKADQYVHRVPLSKVKQIGKALDGLSGGSDPVTAEQILESDFLKEEGSPPSYQIYIVLAFLKDRGVITSVGREGFLLPILPSGGIDAVLRAEAA